MNIKWNKCGDAEKKGLMQLSLWLEIRKVDSKKVLINMHKQVMINKNREAMFVKDGGRIALFVNRVV